MDSSQCCRLWSIVESIQVFIYLFIYFKKSLTKKIRGKKLKVFYCLPRLKDAPKTRLSARNISFAIVLLLLL
jgi:hypothetical protein